MDHTNLTTFVMYYALFHKKLFDNQQQIVKSFPKKIFGVFSTIRRPKKLKSYPTDIHGCIGYWDTDFKTLDKQSVYDNLLRVAYDSVWNDSRKQYFKPIKTDPQTILEIDFMLNPIYKVDQQTGVITELNTKLSNKIFGIIIQTKDKTKRATYLPNVFPNISWKKLLESIKNKANITSEPFDIYAYQITQIKSKFADLLTDHLFSYICISSFSRLLIDNMKPNLTFPFIYSCKNNMVEWYPKDDVRNIATLSDVFKYANLYPDIAKKSELKIIKEKILSILQNLDQYSSQGLSFLGYVYQLSDNNININNDRFCKKLLKDLPFAEDEFEKQELIIGLNKAGCNMIQNQNIPLRYNPNDSIFKMNWVIQAIISGNKKPSDELIFILESKINNILTNKKMFETNFIAVAFEALCFVYRSTGRLLPKIFELLFELEQRKNCYNVLYSFLDNSSRVDITGHILNGLYELRR